jgi:hypothetical protein
MLSVACTDDVTSLVKAEVRAAHWHAADSDPCNPVAREWDCTLPYPSDWFRQSVEGPEKWRMRLPDVALPHKVDGGQAIDLPAFATLDGFAVGSQIAVRIPGGVDPKDLLAPYRADKSLKADELAASVQKGHTTLIMEAGGQVLVPHVAEIDPRPDNPDDRLLILRPLRPLAFGRRHIVVLRKAGLHRADGSAIARPKGMQALIDSAAPATEPLKSLHAWYAKAVWPSVAKAGVPRADVLLAWDFTVASQTSVQGDLLRVREVVQAALATAPVAIKVTSVQQAPEPHVARRIHAELQAPSVMTSCEPGARLFRNDSGEIAQNGMCPVPCVIVVPPSVDAPGAAAARPKQVGRIVQYGHGFFGSREEAQGGHVAEFSDQLGAITVGLDWWGMSKNDFAVVVDDLVQKPWQALRFTERVNQAMANQLTLARAAKTTLADLPELQRDGKPIFDPKHVYFYGNSQGHILGGVYVAVALDVDRALLGVGGAGFGHMMARARPFADFRSMIDIVSGSPAQTQRVQLLMVSGFDRIDPLAWAQRLQPDAKGKFALPVLLHTGIGDAQVPNLASHVHARALGAVHLQPAPRPIFGLKPHAGPVTGHALVEFDFGVPTPDALPTPGDEGNGVHEGVRRLKAAIQQADAFFQPSGAIAHTCSGACDPE